MTIMKKKVLGLVASPRRSGNCEMLVKEMLLAGGESWDKEIITLHELAIKPCQACYRCLPEGARCVLPDDFRFLTEKIAAADALVIAAPCYFLGPNAVFKNVLDRFLSVANEGSTYRGKPCVTFTTYGIPQWYGFGQEFTNMFARFLGLDLKESFLVRAAYPGEFMKDARLLQEVKEVAQNLFNPSYTKETDSLSCPACWNRKFLFESGGRILWCPVCGLRAKIEADGDGIKMHFEDSAKNRFTPEEMRHHFQEVLPAVKDEFIARLQEIKELQQKYKGLNWKAEKEERA